MRTKKPTVYPSEVSAATKLKIFMESNGVYDTGDGVKYLSNATRELSAHFRCFSKGFCDKFLPQGVNDAKLTCFGGKINWNDQDAYAYLWARKDSVSIDIDLAILPLDENGNPGETISAIYHPIFEGRTALAAEVASQIDAVPQNFKIETLSAEHRVIAEAFNIV